MSFPQRLFQILSNFKDLSPQERWAYFRLRVQSGAFRGRLCNPPLPRDPRSVLFVCQGNIIRSPFAAALFHRLLPSALQKRIHVASAGLDTTPGKPADPRALQLAKEFDVPLDAHRTQRLTSSLVERADLIVVMDALNVAKFVVRYPGARDKLFMLGAFSRLPRGSSLEIPDPYNGTLDDVRKCYQSISERLAALSQLIVRADVNGVPLDARKA